MLPSTLTGLFFFVVLMLPGFAYLVGKERHGTERHTSPFRETISVVAASVTTEVIVLAMFAVARWLLPSRTPDVGALIHDGNAYIADNYRSLGTWALCMLTLAVVFAYFATVPGMRRLLKRIPVVGSYPHDSTVSAWWIMFEKWPQGRNVEVGCILDDGSYVAGFLGSFNNSADDSPDRDLVLKAPIQYRPPGASEPIPHPVSAVNIPASRIVSMFVNYEKPEKTITPTIPAAQSELAAAEGVAEAAQPAEQPGEETTVAHQS